MTAKLPKFLLFVQLVCWAALLRLPALQGRAQPADALERTLEARREQLSSPCDPLPYLQAFRGCMDNLGNCDADVLVPTR